MLLHGAQACLRWMSGRKKAGAAPLSCPWQELACIEHRLLAADLQVRKLMDKRLEKGWSFSTLFLVKDSLAIMQEAGGLLEDAVREYSELEACYLEALASGGPLAGAPFGTPRHHGIS